MQWPWVSRRAFDLVLADRDFWRDVALGAHPDVSIVSKGLAVAPRPVDLRRVTATGPTGSGGVSSASMKTEDVVSWNDVGFAIAARAGQSGPLRAHLAEFAQQRKAAGDSNAEILRRVTDWSYQGSDVSPTRERDRADAEAAVAAILDADE